MIPSAEKRPAPTLSRILLILAATGRLFAQSSSTASSYELHYLAGGVRPSGDGAPAIHASFEPTGELVSGTDGTLYLYDRSARAVRAVRPDGILREYAHNVPGDAGLAIDEQNRVVYSASDGHVVRTDTTTGKATILAGARRRGLSDGMASIDLAAFPRDLALARDGSLYFTDWEGTIGRIMPSGEFRLIGGNRREGTAQVGVLASQSPLQSPRDVELDGEGRVYFIEFLANRIWRIELDGRLELLVDLAVLQRRPEFMGSGPLTARVLPCLSVTAQGNVYFVNRHLKAVMRRSAAGDFTLVAGGGMRALAPGVEALGTLIDDARIHVDQEETLFIQQAGKIHRLNEDGTLKGVLGTQRISDPGPAGLETPSPGAMATWTRGDIWFVEEYEARLVSVGTNGLLTGRIELAGSCYAAASSRPGFVDITPGPGDELILVSSRGSACAITADRRERHLLDDSHWSRYGLQPPGALSGVASDVNGILYLTAPWDHTIYRRSPDGQLGRFAGNQRSGVAAEGVPAALASLQGPTSPAIGPDRNLYFTEPERGVIRFVDASGALRSLNRPMDNVPPQTGQPVAFAFLAGVHRLRFDDKGRLHFLLGDGRLFRIDEGGQLRHLAGSGQPLDIERPPSAVPATAAAVWLDDFAFAPNGEIWGSDRGHQRIVRLAPSGPRRLRIISGDAQQGPAGSTLPRALRVRVETASGMPVPSELVSFRVTNGAAEVSHPAVSTDASGAAAVFVHMGPGEGTVRVEASAEGISAVTFALNRFPSVYDAVPIVFEGSVLGGALSTPALSKIAVNGISTLFGEALAPAGTFRGVEAGDIVGGVLPTQLAGVCVSIGGNRAGMLLVTPGQINFVNPEPAGPRAAVSVTRNCDVGPGPVTSPSVNVEIVPSAPEFLVLGKSASGQPLAVAAAAQTGELIGPPGTVPGVATRPARAGEVLTIYAIGLGKDRSNSPPLRIRIAPDQLNLTPLFAYADRSRMPESSVLYIGVTPGFAGLYQVNWRVPDSATSGLRGVVLHTAHGSSPVVYLALEPTP